MEEKVFRTSRRMVVVMDCVGVADEDGNVTIVDVRSIELPSAGEMMDGLTPEECEQFDADFAAAP
jgi:aspartokinase-like uncharacterized kinase